MPSASEKPPSSRPPFSALGVLATVGGSAIVGWLVFRSFSHTGRHALDHAPADVPAAWPFGVLPFAALLAAIAVLPLLKWTEHWWESNRNRLIVSLVAAGTTLAYYAATSGLARVPDVLEESIVHEYLPFMVFLFSLYVISGGIQLSGDLRAHPATNTAFLAVGALSASFIGTTGASMLLIRPLLQTNSERRHVAHTVAFFIFLVSNIGGCLLPIGDPPLLLGYFRGVPFQWTLTLWQEWAFCCTVLLIVYWLLDRWFYRHETASDIRSDERVREPIRLRGSINFIWLFAAVLVVWHIVPGKKLVGTNLVVFPFARELLLLGLTTASLITTPSGLRARTRFSYQPIIEVAAIFVGIFITMQPALEVLRERGASLGLDHPVEFFWITGALSSFLDNAPTYIVFFQTANTLTTEPGPGIIQLNTGEYIRDDLLAAISLGAVFMGANTYIGNGPNFMVRAIAAQSGVAMPTFLGFFFRYTIPILVPLFVIVTLIFL